MNKCSNSREKIRKTFSQKASIERERMFLLRCLSIFRKMRFYYFDEKVLTLLLQ